MISVNSGVIQNYCMLLEYGVSFVASLDLTQFEVYWFLNNTIKFLRKVGFLTSLSQILLQMRSTYVRNTCLMAVMASGCEKGSILSIEPHQSPNNLPTTPARVCIRLPTNHFPLSGKFVANAMGNTVTLHCSLRWG